MTQLHIRDHFVKKRARELVAIARRMPKQKHELPFSFFDRFFLKKSPTFRGLRIQQIRNKIRVEPPRSSQPLLRTFRPSKMHSIKTSYLTNPHPIASKYGKKIICRPYHHDLFHLLLSRRVQFDGSLHAAAALHETLAILCDALIAKEIGHDSQILKELGVLYRGYYGDFWDQSSKLDLKKFKKASSLLYRQLAGVQQTRPRFKDLAANQGFIRVTMKQWKKQNSLTDLNRRNAPLVLSIKSVLNPLNAQDFKKLYVEFCRITYGEP